MLPEQKLNFRHALPNKFSFLKFKFFSKFLRSHTMDYNLPPSLQAKLPNSAYVSEVIFFQDLSAKIYHVLLKG